MERRVKVLILNGTSAAAVQALTVLNPQRYAIHVCDSNPKCWCRFHRHCTRFFQSPLLGANPEAFFAFIMQRLKSEPYDVILAVHEEGLLLAKYRHLFKEYAGLLISDAEAYNTVMNKELCLKRAQSLGISIPPTVFTRTIDEVTQEIQYPLYVKLPYGTSSSGVKRITSFKELAAQFPNLDISNGFILQKEISGDLCVIQSIFVDGKLIASHQYLALAKGFGGGASRRLSVDTDDLREYAKVLGADLRWNGPLMLDFIRDHDTGIAYLIEGNPRIGETYNAFLAGLPICEIIIAISLGKPVIDPFHSRAGVYSHQMTTEVTAAIKRDETLIRKWIIAFSALARWGKYRPSREELIHPLSDPYSFYRALSLIIDMPFYTKEKVVAHDSATTRNMAVNAKAVATILRSEWDQTGSYIERV